MSEKQNTIIHLGRIEWFGGYNHKTEKYNIIGYIDNIRFQKDALASSRLEQHIQTKIKHRVALYTMYNEQDATSGANWVKLIGEMTGDEIIHLYYENDSMKKLFKTPLDCLPFLYLPPIQELFKEIIKKFGLQSLLEYYLNDVAKDKKFPSNLINLIPWKELSNKQEEIEFLLIYAKYDNRCSAIMSACYPLWIDDQRVIRRINQGNFSECINIAIRNNNPNEISKLYDNLTNPLKKKLIPYLPFDKYVSESEYLNILSDEQKAQGIRECFEQCLSDHCKKIELLLSEISPRKTPKSAIALGEKLLESNIPIDAWKLLTKPEKVWFILYLSFHFHDLDKWKKSFGEIYLYEHNNSNQNFTITAAIKFLTIYLVEQSKKFEMFIDAHKYLEKAIEQDFETLCTPSQELLQLMCICKNHSSSICAARYWEKNESVWCNTFRRSCDLFYNISKDGIDFNKTLYSFFEENNHDNSLCSLSLADLLTNIQYNPPSLDVVYKSVHDYTWEFGEYPYRIGGRILQLSRLFSHMHCSCGKTMRSNYAYSVKIDARMSITHAYCSESKNDSYNIHDNDVYLNECWNCNEVIDSRECHYLQSTYDGQFYPISQNDNSGYYVCMHCGAGVQYILPSICPNCGCSDPNKLRFHDMITNDKHHIRYFNSCANCGHSRNRWKSRYE